MLKKDITFKDLDGNDVTETFYFQLSKVEIAKLSLTTADGGLVAFIQEIVKKEDADRIIETFEKIVAMAYGVRGEDGRRFIKSPELSKEFMETDAYSELFMQLVTDAEFAAQFVIGVIPQDIKDRLPAEVQTNDGRDVLETLATKSGIDLSRAQETLASQTGPEPIVKPLLPSMDELMQAADAEEREKESARVNMNQINNMSADELRKALALYQAANPAT